MKKKKRLHPGQIVSHVTLIMILLLLLYPLAMALWSAFKSNAQFELSMWVPSLPMNFENVSYAIQHLWKYILNTVLVGGIGTIGVLIVSSLAAYAFARMKFFLKEVLFYMVLGLMMIPAVMTLVPSFMLYKSTVGTDSYLILIIPIISGGSVFGTFLLRSSFESIDKSIFEAAKIDGANEFLCYMRIGLPLVTPIVVTLAIMQLIGTWNDYLWPMIAIPTDTDKLTIAAAIKKEFLSANGSNYPVLFAGYLISSVPLILLFVFSNKFYVEGLTNSAVKF